MRETRKHYVEKPLLVNIEGLTGLLSCGETTARKIADYAEAKVMVGRRVLYNVEKIRKYIDAIAE